KPEVIAASASFRGHRLRVIPSEARNLLFTSNQRPAKKQIPRFASDEAGDTGSHPGLDDFFRAQCVDLFLAVAELSQNFVGMLAQERRALDVGGAVGHLDR